MKTITVPVTEAAGHTLARTVYPHRDTSRKIYARGHVLAETDLARLKEEGIAQVDIAHMDDGDISELEGAMAVAAPLVCGYARLEIAPGGRINVIADTDCCAIVDAEILRLVNSTDQVSVATVRHFSLAAANSRIATVKTRPFFASAAAIAQVIDNLTEFGAAIQARPIQGKVAVIYSDPNDRFRAQGLFESVVKRKLSACGIHTSTPVFAIESQISSAIHTALRANPSVILIASTTAPAGPDDAVGQGMKLAGCEIERFMAPVEPGNFMLLGYRGETAVLSAPACWRSVAPNIVDYLLPALLSNYQISQAEISNLGHGGLLG